jgi:hypothetical protein
MRSCFVVMGGLVAVGCTGKSGVQPISGQVSLASFPGAVTKVRASRAGAAAIEAPVGADGTFLLPLTAGRGYRIDFPIDGASASLVFPRKTGSTDYRFDVRGGGARFDMGMVRYMGPADQLTTVVFRHSAAQTTTPPPADPGPDVDCENGHDKKTGAVCADDDQQDQGDSCGDEGGPGDTTAPPATVAVADQNVPPAVGSCSDEGDSEKEGD